MDIEQATLLMTLLNSTFLAGLFLYFKFRIEKKLKKYDYLIEDIAYLNTKIHDRLVVFNDLIKNRRPITSELEKSLSMCASRLEKHDIAISASIKELIQTWKDAFFIAEEDEDIRIDMFEKSQAKCYEIITEIKSMVDKLVK